MLVPLQLMTAMPSGAPTYSQPMLRMAQSQIRIAVSSSSRFGAPAVAVPFAPIGFPFVSRQGERYGQVRALHTLFCRFAQKARKAWLVTTERFSLKTLRIHRRVLLTDLSK